MSQNFQNWVSTAKLGKCQKCSKYFQCNIWNTQFGHCGKKVQFSKVFRADGTHISKIYNRSYKKICLKIPSCVAIVMHDK